MIHYLYHPAGDFTGYPAAVYKIDNVIPFLEYPGEEAGPSGDNASGVIKERRGFDR